MRDDLFREPLDRAIAECNQAVDKVTAPYDIDRDIAWSHLGFVTQRNLERILRQQKRREVYKWLGLVAFVVCVIVLALVAMNQIP